MSGATGAGAAAAARAARSPSPVAPVSFTTRSMGGRLSVHLDAEQADVMQAAAVARVVFTRVEAWAARLTRHTDTSDLARLNADPRVLVPVRPTLAAALLAGREAMLLAPGLVDIALLDARLATEQGRPATGPTSAASAGRWSVAPGRHGSAVVGRPPGVRFDLGGVGKGWLADRALRLLVDVPGGPGIGGSAIVDADGDMAVRTAAGRSWEIAVDDPRVPDGRLATLRLGGTTSRTWGVATSGTSIHRWADPGLDGQGRGPLRHHLIDPATRLPARTDVVQATVVAGSALHAEAYAKAVVVAGASRGLALLDRSPIRGAVLLRDNGDVLATPGTLPLLVEAA